MKGKQDYYGLLGISREATASEIRDAYIYRVNILHPDRLVGVSDRIRQQAEEELKNVNTAYRILSYPKARRLYDEEVLTASSSANGERRGAAGPDRNSRGKDHGSADDPFGAPSEPYNEWLPDHSWHNDLTWSLLPDWIKGDASLVARLRRGQQIVGKNVRYAIRDGSLVRQLRSHVHINGWASHGKPHGRSNGASIIDNSQLLSDLMARQSIRMNDGPVLHQMPIPLPSSFSYEKVEGMLFGIAVGDALGASSEGLSASYRHKHFGEIREYVSDRRRGHRRRAGQVTDDTQLSFWTVEQLIDDGGLVPDSLAAKFCRHRIRGIGGTVRKFIGNYKDRHIPWYEAGPESLGNGALMRIAPIILPHLASPSESMYADAAIATMITHNDYANNACSVAFVDMLWQLLGMDTPPKPDWWIDTYCSIARELEGDTIYEDANGVFGEYAGPLWLFISSVCKEALRKRLSVEEACGEWMSGANLFETVPSVLYILARHADDPEEAVIRAANDTHDNDSIASIVGAAVGALHGLRGIPSKWMSSLDGRLLDRGGDDVRRLVRQSKQAFWTGRTG